jgi:hypothetical protein
LRAWNGANELNFERLVSRAGALGRGLAALGALGTLAWLGLALGWIPMGPTARAGEASAVSLNLDRVACERIDKAALNMLTVGKALFRVSHQEPDKVVTEVGRYELRGVFTRGGVARAAIRDTKRKKTLIKQAGDTVDAFEVVEIAPNGVKLRRGEEELSLVR